MSNDRTSPETETFLPEQITGEIACILENCSGPEHQSEEALAFLMQSYQSTWEQLREVILRGLAPRSNNFDETGMSRHLREIIGQETTPPLWIYVTKEQIPILEAIADRLDWLESLYAPFITEHPSQPKVADSSTDRTSK